MNDRLETVTDAIADTNRNVGALTTEVSSLTADVASLTSVVRPHLTLDHGYEEPDDE